ncbi:MAG: hypothetical protein KAJ18_08900 [Candidatus Omnitrophica bacterium]|nr:hypothetical protein [Candidatus Omnitrophota bacterium]
MLKKAMSVVLMLSFLAVTSAAFAADVFVTQKGARYHQEICKLIANRETTQLEEKKAIEEGYSPCKRCLKEKAKTFKPVKKAKKTKKK